MEEERLRQRGATLLAETGRWSIPEDADDLTAEEQEQLEEEVVDQATAAQTMQELEAEIRILQGLEAQAQQLVQQISATIGQDPSNLDPGFTVDRLFTCNSVMMVDGRMS